MGEKEEKQQQQQQKNCKSCSHKWESDQSVPSAPDSCLAEPQNVSFVHFSAAYLKFNLTKCDRFECEQGSQTDTHLFRMDMCSTRAGFVEDLQSSKT